MQTRLISLKVQYLRSTCSFLLGLLGLLAAEGRGKADVTLVHHLHALDQVEALPEHHLELLHVAQHLLDHPLELLRLPALTHPRPDPQARGSSHGSGQHSGGSHGGPGDQREL